MKNHILEHFQKFDPILFRLSTTAGPVTLAKSRNPFLRLVSSIINQQLSDKAADTIFKRFQTLFPAGRITPFGIQKLTVEKIRSVGVSNSKARYILGLAEFVASGKIKFNKLDLLSDEDVILKLTEVKGIGRWTAEMFLMFALGREDVFSIGDLGLRRAIEKHYLKGKPATMKHMERISRKWSPYRTYASIVLWRSLD